MISRMFDPGKVVARLVSEAKGMDEEEERAAGAVLGPGRSHGWDILRRLDIIWINMP